MRWGSLRRMLKHRRANRLVACLACWKCHGRAGPNHYTLIDGGAQCGLCGERNPLGNLRKLPLETVTSEYEILLCYVPRNGYRAHGLHINCRTVLGPWVRFASHETMVRAMQYLGATEAQIESHQRHQCAWGQGSSHIRLLPNRRNLLKLDYDLR